MTKTKCQGTLLLALHLQVKFSYRWRCQDIAACFHSCLLTTHVFHFTYYWRRYPFHTGPHAHRPETLSHVAVVCMSCCFSVSSLNYVHVVLIKSWIRHYVRGTQTENKTEGKPKMGKPNLFHLALPRVHIIIISASWTKWMAEIMSSFDMCLSVCPSLCLCAASRSIRPV